jgi:uncharacterized protein YecT (DUF1311 family)
MRVLLAAAFASLSATSHVEAQPTNAQYSPAYQRCQERASSTTAIVACINTELTVQDAALTRRVQQTLRSLNGRQQTRLRTAQNAFVAYRDANCAAYGDEAWGSIVQIGVAACRLDMTIARRLELECFPGYGDGAPACRSRARH